MESNYFNKLRVSFEEENEYTKLGVVNGILYEEYKPQLEHVSLDVAKCIIRNRHFFCKSKSYPILVDTNKVRSADRQARLYFSSHEGLRFLNAGAILTHHNLAKLSGNIYLLLCPPVIPAKLFTNLDNALKWLSFFRFQS